MFALIAAPAVGLIEPRLLPVLILTQVAGNLAMPGFTAPKLLWVRRHEPQIFARIASVLLPKDYLRLWLTGEHVSEMSDASGTSWLDVAQRKWSADLLAATTNVTVAGDFSPAANAAAPLYTGAALARIE